MGSRREDNPMPARRERGGHLDPWSRLTGELDRMFDEFWVPSFFRRGSTARTWSPQVDVFERKGHLVVRADLPGIRKDDLDIEVTDRMLVIKGERRHEEEREDEGYYRFERAYGSFMRAIPIPEGVDPEQVTASINEGVLEIAMPLPQQTSRSRRVEVQQPRDPELAGAGAQRESKDRSKP
ncbi:MAG: Hsp20/alpha crystallin family protein [Candidatus Polarisedimenticolia bacterium]